MAIIAIWHKRRQQGSGNPGIKGQKLFQRELVGERRVLEECRES